MSGTPSGLSPMSPAAMSARQLSLRSTEERLRSILERVATDPPSLATILAGYRERLVAFTADRTIIAANEAAEHLVGWGRDELVGSPTDALVPLRLRQPDAPPIQASDTLTTVELPGLCRDGREPALSWTFGAVETPRGPIFVMLIRDRAEIDDALEALYASEQRFREEAEQRLSAERAARESAEARRDQLARLHALAHALSSATTAEEVGAVVIKDLLGAVDAAGGALYARSADGSELRLLGEYGHPAGFLAAHPTFSTALPTPAGDVLRTRAPLFFEHADELVARYPELERDLRAGGFEAGVTIPLIARDVIGVLAVRYREHHMFSDAERSLLMTMAELCAQALERARLFDAQMRARAEAEAANRAKDEFLAMLGHELRNPLAPIATAVELMKLRGETHSMRERDVIERQLGHITRLVDDLLDISRITRGKLELSLNPVDMADVVARAVEMASPLLEQRHHSLSLDVPRGWIVNADLGRLAQVVANLLSNAAKYTPPNGRIVVAAASRGTEVVIRVADNGIGIPPELLPRVFDLFVQGKRTFDRSDGGLGIGLALVKNLVSLHGGTVTATSQGPGRGSEFTVALPLFAQAAVSARASVDTTEQAVKRGRRVLVVDDNTDFADMLAASLEALGYHVTKASDAVSALERLQQFPAEAAVLDLGLPVLDGFELARKIQEQFPARTPRLIAVTGYGQQHDRSRSADAGFVEHLVKPIDMNVMVAALER